MRAVVWFPAVALAVAVLCGPSRADVKAGQQALLKGQWAEAEKAFQSGLAMEKGPGHLGLAEVYLMTGRYPDALKRATEASLVPATKARGLCLAGEIHRETGKPAEAVKMFQGALQANPNDLRARVYLGITQQETGQKAAAEKTLDQFFQLFNAGKIDATKADQLTYTAMAARRLAAWQDASNTFQSAVEKDPNFLLANLEWGELFLQKYNTQEAAKCLAEVLKVNKNHPRALVAMAGVRVEAAYDVEGATKLADQALAQNPRYVPALSLKARLALDDEQFSPAETLLKQALEINPNNLEALSLLAASRYLQGETSGFEGAKGRALKVNPVYSDLFYTVAELAVRHHRYADGVKLNRDALALDPKNANALAALGMNLLRLGMAREAEGLKALQQAFELDGFNIRTFNTLNLYEQVIAKEYETVNGGTFIYRYNKKEKPLLHRYVPALMEQFWAAYVKKYGFTPKNPITIELFTERQHYGARTIGLPELGAQGTCFGELITAMSPASAEANWELVLAHELAHVFHLQLSNNRVPRWFTEGLAEYETNVVHPYWKREHALDIYLSLRRGDLWKISELSAAFTRPDRPNGVVIAYQQSSLVIHYLAETYGFPKLVEALKLYAAGKHDDEVLPAITGKKLEQLDTEFRAFFLKRYPHYQKGFLFDQAGYSDLGAFQKAAKEKSNDAAAQADLAAAMLAAEEKGAEEQARKALALDATNAIARYVLAAELIKAGDLPGAKKEFETMLTEGVDGYALQYGLGRIAAQNGELESAIKHLNDAKKWDPDRAEPYALLMQLYEKQQRRDDLLKEAEAYLDIQEHDHDAARLLIDRYSGDKRWADVVRIGPRVIGITPMETYVHQQYGMALAELKRPKEAIVELESALAGGIRKPGPIRAVLARQYLATGDKAKAKALATEALKEDPGNPEAMAVLKEAS